MSTSTARLSTPARAVSWIAQLLAAAILGQTLFFKFTGAPETIALFEVLGAEPAGRYATAAFELIAVVLLLVPKTAAVGGLLAMGIMTGAIGGHLTKLGVSIDPAALGNEDLRPLEGPSLFVMACITFVSGAVVAFLRRGSIPVVGKLLGGSANR